jgi:hypothetical protein
MNVNFYNSTLDLPESKNQRILRMELLITFCLAMIGIIGTVYLMKHDTTAKNGQSQEKISMSMFVDQKSNTSTIR